MFSTRDACKQLRGEGYDVDPVYVAFLLRQGLLDEPQRLGRSFVWQDADLARLRDALHRRGRGPARVPSPSPAPAATS